MLIHGGDDGVISDLPSYRIMYSVACESGNGKWYGRFVELPGTTARASTKQLLLETLREELIYHVEWLRKRGFSLPNPDLEFYIDEEISNVKELGESGGEVALFSFDVQVIPKEQIEYMVKLMGCSREDLLALTNSIPPESFTYVPPGKKRDITKILHHICNAEEYYISRLGEEADVAYEKNTGMPEEEIDDLPVFERLKTVRNACVKTLEEIIPKKDNSILTRAEYTDYPEERWTGHKVMRRFLEHEREHYYNILEYLGKPVRSAIR